MGSLMSGWDSHILDSKSAKYKRNRSLTKEGIDSYWKSKKKTEQEHLKSISLPSHSNQEMEIKHVEEFEFQRSSSLPAEIKTNMKTERDLDEFIKKNGWWKGSNMAFLNEPPVLEQSSNSYTAQFHIANSKLNNNNNNNNNNTGIGT